MISTQRTIVLLLAWLFGGVLTASGEDFRFDRADGVVLLKNGSAMRGQVLRQGDHYVVSFGDSGHARVAARNVEVVCRTIEEAYRHKLSLIDRSAESRLALAQWCLHQDLLARTADQLLAIESEQGSTPQVEALHRRLLLAARSDGTQPETNGADAAPTARVAPDQALKALPPGTVEYFTSAVQPLLLNRCSNAGCHSLRSGSSLVLLRPSAAQLLTRRMTEHNLLSTVSQINREVPQESALLRNAQVAHGGADTAAIPKTDSKHWQLLARWLGSMRVAVREAKPTTIVEPNELLLQTTAGRSLPASEVEPRVPATDTSRDYRPVDPFDPDIFNRRHHTVVER